MLLHRQTKDCLHCKAPMSLIREVNIDPRQDHKLRWVIAGQDPEKMEKKRSNANRLDRYLMFFFCACAVRND